MADLNQTEHDKAVNAQKALTDAEGDFDGAMKVFKLNPTAKNQAKVHAAQNRFDEATRHIELLDRLFKR